MISFPFRRYAFPIMATLTVTSTMLAVSQYKNYGSTTNTRPIEPRSEISMDVDDRRCPTRYTAPEGRGIKNRKGRPLVVDPDLLKRLGIPPKKFVDLNRKTVKEFVFATGASMNHRFEVKDSIAAMQRRFPERRIFFYDLGLTWRARRVFERLCGVTVRVFNFTEFPPYVSDLKRYAWKPIIIQDLLQEYPGVFWMDASVRLRSGDLTAAYRLLLKTGGIMQFKDLHHSNFAVTNPKLYEYFPTNLEEQKKTAQSIGGIVIVLRTEAAYWNVFHWWVLCALVEDCISPITTKYCDFKAHGDKWKLYVGCHRFDQAVISLLNSNYFGFNSTHYTLDESSRIALLSINRTDTEYNELQNCDLNYHPASITTD